MGQSLCLFFFISTLRVGSFHLIFIVIDLVRLMWTHVASWSIDFILLNANQSHIETSENEINLIGFFVALSNHFDFVETEKNAGWKIEKSPSHRSSFRHKSIEKLAIYPIQRNFMLCSTKKKKSFLMYPKQANETNNKRRMMMTIESTEMK